MRLKNLKDLNLGPSDFTFMSSLENNLEALKSNYNEFNSDLGTADKYEGALEEQSKLNAVANSSTLEGFVLEAKEIKTNINDLIQKQKELEETMKNMEATEDTTALTEELEQAKADQATHEARLKKDVEDRIPEEH